MGTRLIIALSVVLFFTPARPLLAAEHPRPQLQQLPQITTRPTQSGIQTKEVSAVDISAGIKKQIASDTKKSSDRKFHVRYGPKDLALDLIKVHDDRLSSLSGGKYFAGVDQHGQKVQQSAAKAGVPPAEFVKGISQKFVDLAKKLDVQYDDWAETTDPLHKKCVQGILRRLFDEGQIYKDKQAGYYSVRQEQFLTDKERGADGEFGKEWG